MPLAFKEAQERLADLVAAPKLWLCLRAAHDVLRWFPIIAECAGQHQWVRFRGGGPRVCVATGLDASPILPGEEERRMANFLEYNPEQAYLLPPTVREVLG